MNIVTLLLLAAFQLSSAASLWPCLWYSANFCHGCRLTLLVGREKKSGEEVGAVSTCQSRAYCLISS
eukprot:scaffold108513_cov23-Cyclotella_meneghiniana.AAC.2